MTLKYNAPTVLTFTFISTGILVLSQVLWQPDTPTLTETWFLVPGSGQFSPREINHWVGIVTHVLGHGDWEHLVTNLAYILLIGPMLEESYGSDRLLFMIILTSVFTGIINIFFFHTGLLGASGVVFMMILLASFTNFSKGEIPLTFIMILLLYLGREIYNSFSENNISQFAHIVGGLFGSIFGFSGFFARRKT